MTLYRVALQVSDYSVFDVEAEDEDDAVDMAYDRLEDAGVSASSEWEVDYVEVIES